jgi:hypothetical protein
MFSNKRQLKKDQILTLMSFTEPQKLHLRGSSPYPSDELFPNVDHEHINHG